MNRTTLHNKPLKPDEFKAAAENYFKNQTLFQKGRTPQQIAAQRTEHYTEGYEYLQQVATILKELAETHSDPEKRTKANLAISKLDTACGAFGHASLNHGVVHDYGGVLVQGEERATRP